MIVPRETWDRAYRLARHWKERAAVVVFNAGGPHIVPWSGLLDGDRVVAVTAHPMFMCAEEE